MIDLAIAAAILLTVALVIWVCFGWLPTRRQYKLDLTERRVDGNHQDMHLLLYELLALDRRGLFAVFPDDETRGRAQGLVDTYRAQHTTPQQKELP